MTGLRSGFRSLSYFTGPPNCVQNAADDRRAERSGKTSRRGTRAAPKKHRQRERRRVSLSAGPTFSRAPALRLRVRCAGAAGRDRFLSLEGLASFFQAGRAGARGGREATRRRTTAPCCTEKRDARNPQENPSFPQVFGKEPGTACLTRAAERP